VQQVLRSRCRFFIPYYVHRATMLFLNQTLDNKNNMPKICEIILMQENMVKDISCCWCCSDVLCYVWLQCSHKFSVRLCCTTRKTVHVYGLTYSTISCKWPTWCTILFLHMFIPNLYMFRAIMCSSSGELIVSIQHLVYVTLCRWPSGMQVCISDSHLHRVTYTRCHIDTINSPDDEHMSARNM